ncbi:unnamed protein product [Adineta ricciae]|uniref:Uncharacterized protein n=1 Tax=Adineta ricciae TaxID=249248 RepID=A0A813NUF5_ADIRI|nr:unnamed protein product [Adineta ricciae]
MNRRNAKRLTFSIFQWLLESIAVIFGIVPQLRTIRRISTTRKCRNTIGVHRTLKRQKFLRNKGKSPCAQTSINMADINNNNNNNLSCEIRDNQCRILCFQVENDQILDYIRNLFIENASLLKTTQIIDFEELMRSIQSTKTNKIYEDASTMTTSNQNCCQHIFCSTFMTQSENTRRLKASGFIRLFLEKSKDEFYHHLINEERLCQQKTSAIYQMIKEFLKVIHKPEHEQNEILH